jgi:excisionase family DNA binding protein
MLRLNGDYANVQEAAKLLELTESYVRRLLRDGSIQGAVKTGRDWIILVVDGKIKIKDKDNERSTENSSIGHESDKAVSLRNEAF